ncbi:MAG: hypothetical protein LC130_24770 [Bryobacterales bacterium]|nr:hypothetical protein [Bryobacterales bacterium]
MLGTENFGNGIVVAGSKDNPYGYATTNSKYDAVAPRVGFSYVLTGDNRTVLRGGYGMFYDRWSQFISSTRNNYPFNRSISIYNTSFSNPSGGTRRIFPSTIVTMTSPWDVPYLQKWSLDVQRQFREDLVVMVGYVGSKGNHLIRTRDWNQPVPSTQIATGAVSANALRPFPGFAGITAYNTTANSTYHSLQSSVVRRFSRGFSVQGSYTWSKSIDDAVSPYDIYSSYRTIRGLSNFDRRHMLIASYIWELPFARNLRGWQRKALHGWQISGITNFQTGNPFSIGISPDRAGTGGGGQRADIVSPVTVSKQKLAWFSTGSFALPALGAFGNSGRNIITGPGINNWDLSFSKRTDLRENIALQFRAEFFNLFNHTQWSGVGSTLAAGTFGQVTSARDPRITQFGLRLLF